MALAGWKEVMSRAVITSAKTNTGITAMVRPPKCTVVMIL